MKKSKKTLKVRDQKPLKDPKGGGHRKHRKKPKQTQPSEGLWDYP